MPPYVKSCVLLILIEIINTYILSWENTNPLLFIYLRDTLIYFYATDYTLMFTLKLTLCLMFLIVIRGCVPRYRYDFLTKMGWVKFLGYVLALFLVSIFLFLIW